MAAVVRAPSQQDEDAPAALTRPSRQRVSRTEVDYRKLHRGTFAKETALAQASGKSSEASESRLDTVLRAITGVRESVDERFALMQEAITERSDIEQIKATISDELRNVVQERLKTTVQRTIVDAIRDEVAQTVQQQVGEAERSEVKNVVQQEVKSIIQDAVANSINEQVTAIVQQQVTAIVQQQVTRIQLSSPSPSYADVARTPPGSHPSNVRMLSNQTTPSTLTDTLYCTVDLSNVEEEERGRANASKIRQEIEEEMRKEEGGSGWRCVAVMRDPRNADRIRIICRDEDELARVKGVAKKAKASGARVLRDQWYPVKVVTAMLEKENEVKIAKVSWLSRKDSPKAYGSMVVYVTKRADAARLLEGQYFNVDGESAFTRVFESRRRPVQCFKCLGLGHKALSCARPQVCSRCAQPGHRHNECQADSPKCAVCSGPHDSSIRQCWVLYPSTNF
jgi:hypothetical protein